MWRKPKNIQIEAPLRKFYSSSAGLALVLNAVAMMAGV